MNTIPDNILQNFGQIISEALVNGDQVALPSFGTLETVKIDEQIVTDGATGKRVLMPPVIRVQFTSALKMIKRIKERRASL